MFIIELFLGVYKGGREHSLSPGGVEGKSLKKVILLMILLSFFLWDRLIVFNK